MTQPPTEPTKLSPLTKHQKHRLDMLSRGYGISAARREWKAKEYREMLDLVARGLAVITKPAPWNKAGSFSRPD